MILKWILEKPGSEDVECS